MIKLKKIKYSIDDLSLTVKYDKLDKILDRNKNKIKRINTFDKSDPKLEYKKYRIIINGKIYYYD